MILKVKKFVSLTPLNPHFIAKHFLLKGLKKYFLHVNGGTLLDVGCGNKPYQEYVKPDKYIGIDIKGGGHEDNDKLADKYFDGRNIPFDNESVDWILSTEVLEHINEPKELLKECHRVLKPQGKIILSTPQCWGLHEEPYDYYRYTKYGLKYLFEECKFKVIDVTPTNGTWATIGQRISSYFFYNLGGKYKVTKLIVSILFCMPVQLVTMIIDKFTKNKGDTLDNVIFAEKSG